MEECRSAVLFRFPGKEQLNSMAGIRTWLKKELLEILPVWAFFFVSFSLLGITVSAVLSEYHVELFNPPEYFVAALIVAKAVLVVDTFFKKELFRGRPLVYITIWNTVLYVFTVLVFHHADRMIKLMRREHVGVLEANRTILDQMAEPGYWAAFAWVVALIFGFCMVRELIRLLGSDRFMDAFFGRHRFHSSH
jgi:hypothetical protein